MMDWSFVKSDLWFIQSFILSNTIEWHFQNTLLSNWMDMREGRFFNSNDSYHLNELSSIWICLNWSQFIITHLLPSRLSSLSSSKLFFPITTLSNSFNPSITNRSTFSKQSFPISIRFNDINRQFNINDDISGLLKSLSIHLIQQFLLYL